VGPFGLGGGGLIDGGDRLDEKVVPAEAGVAFATVRVQDPEGRPPPRRAVSVAGDQRLRALADDVPPKTDPRPAGELEAQTAGGRDGAGERPAQPGRLEDDEARFRPTGECRQPSQPVGDVCRPIRGRQPAARQVQHQEIHGSSREERTGDGQPLVERGRGDDDEPFQAHAPGDRLDRVEGACEIEPRDDRTHRLCLRHEPQRQGGPTAGAITPDGDTGGPGEAARTQDRVQAREPRVEDPFLVGPNGWARLEPWLVVREWLGHEGQCQRAHDPRSCGPPSRPKARDSGVHISTSGRHRTTILEHLF
jgi:hypothetical protein